jgi:Fe-S-cluster containining protein
MDCRIGCGACCIAPSISSPIPGMPFGKDKGERCVQLSDDNKCMIFGHPDRPKVCKGFKASVETCGSNSVEALRNLKKLEELTAPTS